MTFPELTELAMTQIALILALGPLAVLLACLYHALRF